MSERSTVASRRTGGISPWWSGYAFLGLKRPVEARKKKMWTKGQEEKKIVLRGGRGQGKGGESPPTEGRGSRRLYLSKLICSGSCCLRSFSVSIFGPNLSFSCSTSAPFSSKVSSCLSKNFPFAMTCGFK